MPEGPSIVILKEEVQQFTGQKVVSVSGNSSIDINRLQNKTIHEFKTWGKHFLICFNGFTVKIHLLMFGTYRVNERKETKPRLSLVFANGELNFYTCSIKILEGDINSIYDWSTDVMNVNWDPKKAKMSLEKRSDKMICDVILDQDVFAGVGNIIKNEVLYRCYIHPESLVGKIPPEDINQLISECSIYSFEFLYWKKKYELKQHWLAYTKSTCLRCNLPIIRKHTGDRNRRSFFCTNCQKLYE
ncbi:DNA-formamidopyrimidine glycosylase family protein [Flavobacterium sp. MC2016-06]|jgi:endonuclease-8|uniref:DNA-formamidopyrimidine glycosylase family protein n=1 Tax=Flavobacterium sp. MC2016-06 TaxID=2676308 RepID=UPI0012BA6E69|nr:DNA-formamidopyrimidine glycosylase family protein [Flavobacterium sp. MC2016-06]MBU3860548.1 endonuclease [Flavobacterium sp. MC2016-06]